jgi:hypothetical protein
MKMRLPYRHNGSSRHGERDSPISFDFLISFGQSYLNVAANMTVRAPLHTFAVSNLKCLIINFAWLFLGTKNYEVDGYFVAAIGALVDRKNDHGTNDVSGQSTHGHYHHLTQPSAQRVEPREVIGKNIVELKALRAVGTESRALAGRVS